MTKPLRTSVLDINHPERPEAARTEEVVKLERGAYAALHMLGARPGEAPRLTITYDHAAGFLRTICETTGESPSEICHRLRITSGRRRRLIQHAGTLQERWRLSSADRKHARQHGGYKDPAAAERWAVYQAAHPLSPEELAELDAIIDAPGHDGPTPSITTRSTLEHRLRRGGR